MISLCYLPLEGLQNCLNSLQKYTEKWKLQVNTEKNNNKKNKTKKKKKTQVITFNKDGKLIKKSFFFFFRFGNTLLKTVLEYKYLGIIIKASGVFNRGISYLSNKALKGVYMIRSTCRFHISEVNANCYSNCLMRV